MPTRNDPQPSPFTALALEKLARVLGPARGRRVFDETLLLMGKSDLLTADDLHLFAEHLTRKGAFEGAVGGLLGVAAVMRGAKARG
jgi:hypothetical protein